MPICANPPYDEGEFHGTRTMRPAGAGGGNATLLASLICAFLGAAVYLQLNADIMPNQGVQQPPSERVSLAERPSLPPPPTYDPPGYEAFADAAARPIFAPTRRPPSNAPVSLVEPVPPAVTFGFELVGVLISGDERLALVRQDGVTVLQHVAIGRSLNGWQVDQIEPDHVIFSSGETIRRVELREDEPPKTETARERRRRERDERRQARGQDEQNTADQTLPDQPND